MNAASVIVLSAVLFLFGLAVRHLRKGRDKGCSGNCAGCTVGCRKDKI